MSTPQWPHTRITLFERTRQSATRRCDDTSWEEASEFLCIKTLPFLREFSNNKIRQNSQECSLWRATNVRFSIFAASAEKEKPCCTRFFENALRAVLIDQLIRAQTFWEIVCFTGLHVARALPQRRYGELWRLKVDVEQQGAEGNQTRISRRGGANTDSVTSACKQMSKQRRQVDVRYDPSLITALRHGTWMIDERSKMTCIKEKERKGDIYQPFYGTWRNVCKHSNSVWHCVILADPRRVKEMNSSIELRTSKQRMLAFGLRPQTRA